MINNYYHPMIVSWELTNACNLNCKYCFNDSGREFGDELTKDETHNVLKGLYDAGVFRIEFTGGEPMMRPDFIDIIKDAHDMDFIISVASNGTLINENIASILKEAEVAHVQVSLDGLKETHDYHKGFAGAFDRVVQGIKCLKDHDIRVHARMTATKKNISEIEEVLKLSASLGADEFNVMRVWTSGRAQDGQLNLNADQIISLNSEMQRLMDLYKMDIGIRYDHCGFFVREAFQPYKEHNERMCQCARTICTIKPNGIVTPCEVLTMRAGDLRVETFADIWRNSPVMDEFRSFNPDNLKGTCGKCSDRNICGGNCRALALLHHGDFYAEDPTCWKVLKNKMAE
jgi:radical SAM protein with 4Fe4S-binding SPASM domain